MEKNSVVWISEYDILLRVRQSSSIKTSIKTRCNVSKIFVTHDFLIGGNYAKCGEAEWCNFHHKMQFHFRALQRNPNLCILSSLTLSVLLQKDTLTALIRYDAISKCQIIRFCENNERCGLGLSSGRNVLSPPP